ncbi:hypothetical protein ISS04_03980 [Candidatus Woesearchaeota archaeon]|nr:hypothetical protein [Candidatus Woesearchaeota archaeon]
MEYTLPRSVEQMISLYEAKVAEEGDDMPHPIEEKIGGLEETIRADPDFPRGSIGDHVRVDSRAQFALELMDALYSDKVDELYITESCFGRQYAHRHDGKFCVTYRLFEKEPEYEHCGDGIPHPDTVLNKDSIITRFTEYEGTSFDFGFIDALMDRLGIDAKKLGPEKLYKLK